jgi:hypothetical protein
MYVDSIHVLTVPHSRKNRKLFNQNGCARVHPSYSQNWRKILIFCSKQGRCLQYALHVPVHGFYMYQNWDQFPIHKYYSRFIWKTSVNYMSDISHYHHCIIRPRRRKTLKTVLYRHMRRDRFVQTHETRPFCTDTWDEVWPLCLYFNYSWSLVYLVKMYQFIYLMGCTPQYIYTYMYTTRFWCHVHKLNERLDPGRKPISLARQGKEYLHYVSMHSEVAFIFDIGQITTLYMNIPFKNKYTKWNVLLYSTGHEYFEMSWAENQYTCIVYVNYITQVWKLNSRLKIVWIFQEFLLHFPRTFLAENPGVF